MKNNYTVQSESQHIFSTADNELSVNRFPGASFEDIKF